MRPYKYLLFFIILFVAFGFLGIEKANAGAEHGVSGWAWSENIGWISFNSLNCDTDKNDKVDIACGGDNSTTPVNDYGVNVDPATGLFSGYAWSENIGWIDLAPAGTYPTPDYLYSACLDLPGGGQTCEGIGDYKVAGWARACSVCADPNTCNCAAAGTNPNAAWDGWLSFKKQLVVTWQKTSNPSASDDQANGVAVDGAGNIYVVGNESVGLDTQWRIEKWDQNGNRIWARTSNPSPFMFANGVAVDGAGNIYVVGALWDSGWRDYHWYVEKWDQNGNRIWARNKVISGWSDVAYGVAVDGAGNIYVVGYGGSMGPEYWWHIEKWDQNGVDIWNRQSGVNGMVNGVAYDGIGNIYVVGYESVGLNTQWHIEKWDQNGNRIWARTFDPSAGWDQAERVVYDGAGNIYVVGYDYSLPGQSAQWHIEKWDQNGNQSWARTSNPSVGYDEAFGVAFAGNIFVVGLDVSGSSGQWRIEEWDQSGNQIRVIPSDPSSGQDVAKGIASGGGIYYVVGWDSIPGGGDTQWRIEKKIAFDYGVSLRTDLTPNQFEGWAFSDMNIGWTSFNCKNCEGNSLCDKQATCNGTHPGYKVTLNFPPTADNLTITTDNYCDFLDPPIHLNWKFKDSGDSQSKYRIQIDDDPNFEEVVETGDSVRGCPDSGDTNITSSGPSGTTFSCHPVGLFYGKTYYWRLKVYDSQGTVSPWIDPVSPNNSFTTPLHAYPRVKFYFSPENPAPERRVDFCTIRGLVGEICTNLLTELEVDYSATCYNAGNSPPYSCSDTSHINATYLWDFGDNNTASDKGNTYHSYNGVQDYWTRLTITDDVGKCFDRQGVPIGLLPKWKEVAPTGWINKFLAGIPDYFKSFNFLSK